MVSINTKRQTSTDGVIRALADTSCPASIDTFYGVCCIVLDSENHDSRGVCSSTPSSTTTLPCHHGRHRSATTICHRSTPDVRQRSIRVLQRRSTPAFHLPSAVT
ncbi:hypothetical protein F2Q70_00029634 [Brassica cretica]|uniref:Uncharacterized protein n=1 Tax=Brassica cretica TaxID=69181 RepID=A0A8S9FES8_BRACR|nr:hypothetical protein F2Q70_00029634 [Brassica cretica]